MNAPAESIALWPMVVYFFAVIALVITMLVLSHILGQRHAQKATLEPFESGVVPVDYARLRLSARFYLVAMLFVIFDLEAVLIFAWAIALREAGWAGYITMLYFIAALLAALIYAWRQGALDWGSKGRKLQMRRS